MRVINLTPHEVKLVKDNIITVYPSKGVLRVKTYNELFDIDGIPIVKQEFIDEFVYNDNAVSLDFLIKEFSSYKSFDDEKLMIIVSLPVLEAIKKILGDFVKDGVYFVRPDTSPESVIRDDEGRIIGVKRFAV